MKVQHSGVGRGSSGSPFLPVNLGKGVPCGPQTLMQITLENECENNLM